MIAETDAAGNVIKSYGYRPGSTWTTDPLFMKVGGQYYFYQNDHLGTPQKLTAVNGAVVWSVKYSSFGQAEVDISSSITNNLRFPGQYFDQETGLHYNWHRYYDPRSGRYINVDPVGFRGGINLFSYAFNSPSNIYDPKGLNPAAIIERILIELEYLYLVYGPKAVEALRAAYQRGFPPTIKALKEFISERKEEISQIIFYNQELKKQAREIVSLLRKNAWDTYNNKINNCFEDSDNCKILKSDCPQKCDPYLLNCIQNAYKYIEEEFEYIHGLEIEWKIGFDD